MNKSRILAVADAIEQHTIPWLGFNMHNYITNTTVPRDYLIVDHTGHNCKTVACIAGWTNALRLDLKETFDTCSFSDDSGAAQWLDISREEDANYESVMTRLFYAHNHPGYEIHSTKIWRTITAEQAIRTLRHLAETGNVDWTV